MDEEPDLPPRQPRRRRPERAALGPRRHQARTGTAGSSSSGNEFFAFTCNDLVFKYLEDVGTFDVNNPLEIRDNAAASTAFGAAGFNVPSLLSVNYHAPYLHRGQAQTLEEVFPLHGLGAGASGFPPTTTIATELNAQEQADLLVFLKSIDGSTAHLRSAGDDFRDALRLQGTCPVATVINEDDIPPKENPNPPTPRLYRGGRRERSPWWRSSVIPLPTR